jgi:hypothetical protein
MSRDPASVRRRFIGRHNADFHIPAVRNFSANPAARG